MGWEQTAELLKNRTWTTLKMFGGLFSDRNWASCNRFLFHDNATIFVTIVYKVDESSRVKSPYVINSVWNEHSISLTKNSELNKQIWTFHTVHKPQEPVGNDQREMCSMGSAKLSCVQTVSSVFRLRSLGTTMHTSTAATATKKAIPYYANTKNWTSSYKVVSLLLQLV